MPVEEIAEILDKYRENEQKIDELFEQTLKTADDGGVEQDGGRQSKLPDFDKAKERNRLLLKELEITKGNLRSKAIFSPAEMQWEKICKRYQEEPALPVTTWRCNLPVFV